LATYSLVIPIFNEEETLPELYRRIRAVAPSVDGAIEIVFVDDGSSDRSLAIIRELRAQDARVGFVSLARNFGHQNAISAGLDAARGDAVIVMDGDLQDPPELIPTLIAKWREGYEVVYAQRTKRRRAAPVKRLGAYVYYRVLSRLTSIEIPRDTGDFCLMDRRIVDLLTSLPERARYLRGLRAWTGFRSAAVPFARDARYAGQSKYTYGRLIGLAANGIVSFTRTPLRLALYLGLGVGVIVAAAALGLALWLPARDAPAWIGSAMIAGAILFAGAVQLVCLGILGEYVGRIHEEVQARPLYVVKETSGTVTAGPQA
jgi:dolichol-phosphate mannosyltransferase